MGKDLRSGGFLKNEDGEITPTSDMILSTTYSISQQYRLDGLSDVDGLYYDGKVGTSMATPLVASVIGLMLSVNPALTPAEVEKIIQTTATKVNGLGIFEYSGVINAAEAVKAVNLAGVNDIPVTGVSVYPNPATDVIRISGAGDVEEIQIFDLNGKMQFSGEIRDGNIDVSGLTSGFYLLHIFTPDGMVLFKLFKQ